MFADGYQKHLVEVQFARQILVEVHLYFLTYIYIIFECEQK